jgi:hypothetical protein
MDQWWRWDGWPTAEEWQAVWGFATVIVAAVAAFFALRQLRASIRAGAEASRPYITADIVFREWGGLAIEIKNSGLSAAKNIQFDWSVQPIATRDDAQAAIDRGLIDEGIPFLAPGRTLVYDLGYFHDLTDESPRRFDVKMRYQGSVDSLPWSSESIIDIEQWTDTLVSERDPYKPIVRAIENLRPRPPLFGDPKDEAARALKTFLEAQPEMRRARARQRSSQRRAEWSEQHSPQADPDLPKGDGPS